MDPLNRWNLNEFEAHLGRLARRLRLRDGWQLAQQTLWIAAAAVVFVQFTGRLLPIANLWQYSMAALAVWLLAVAAYSLFKPLPSGQVARRLDSELGLRERLATALSLESWKHAAEPGVIAASHPAFHGELVSKQQSNALALVSGIVPQAAFPLRLARRPLLAGAALLAGALALALLPNPMDAVLAERAAVAREAEAQAERIEELQDEIQASEELSPEDKEELLRLLAELAEELRANPGDRSEALANISQMEENLRRQLDPNAGLRQANLESLAEQLQALAQIEPSEAAGTDAEQAAEALEALAEQLSEMDTAERQAAAQSLAAMAARAAQAGNGDLAAALSAMAQAAQSGDSQAASQAAQAAAEAMEAAESDLAAQEALENALSQLQSSSQAMSQAGQSMANTPGQGQGQDQGEGQGQGQGQDQGQGNPGGGGGSNANTLPPGSSSGQAGQPQGQGQTGGEGDESSQVFVPWERRPNSGDTVSVPGQDTGEGETQTRETTDPLPGAGSDALLPYDQVYYEYLNSANQTIDQTYIPAYLKDYIREYFSHLEP